MPRSYLAQYGRLSYLGRFQVSESIDLERGQRVIVRSARGLEMARVLKVLDEKLLDPTSTPPACDFVRLVTEADYRTIQQNERTVRDWLRVIDSCGIVSGCPLTILDLELLFDRSIAVVHAFIEKPFVADLLFSQMSERFGIPFQLLDLTQNQAPPENGEISATCSTGSCNQSGGCSDCGSGKSGCGTKNCARKSIRNAADMTSYFANLREQMLATADRRTPLN